MGFACARKRLSEARAAVKQTEAAPQPQKFQPCCQLRRQLHSQLKLHHAAARWLARASTGSARAHARKNFFIGIVL